MFRVVDLFAGPGGLAEGFASVRVSGERVFEIALSVEMEETAFRTLRLRSFFRQFDEAPADYYRYLAKDISIGELSALYPAEWTRAVSETKRLELGTTEAKAQLDPILDELKKGGEQTILIGGPPCQAYSLVGRARNKGIKDYDPSNDHRHFLYHEYIRIIERLRPAAFVMENVKGILSSKVGGDQIFQKVLTDLRMSGGSHDSYELFTLAPAANDQSTFVVKCEDFGIPQRRHRVFVVGIRRDIAEKVRTFIENNRLNSVLQHASVRDVLEGMPRLRSGLYREPDGDALWQSAAAEAMQEAAKACQSEGGRLCEIERLLNDAASILASGETLRRSSTKVTSSRDNRLRAWLADRKLDHLTNHETRGHRRDDLARYAFVSAFGQVFGRSPKAAEFPGALAPAHRNWKSGKFADRFRVQVWDRPSTTVVSHISKDGHYFIHPDLMQCRSLTVREAARLQTFPDNYHFEGRRTDQLRQVGNAVPPLMARQIADLLHGALSSALQGDNKAKATLQVVA